MTREELFKNARLLPATPGVYIMRNSAGTVIYVGKSKALKNRVSSYFAPYAVHNQKTRHMVAAVDRFEVFHTKTELEALILENSFIKQYMPRYNIKLKDSSEYPYIRLSADEYPSLSVEYERKDEKSAYFGPYSSKGTGYAIVAAARKAFKMPSCSKKFPEDIGKGRPCLNYHIGRCMGVCIKGEVSKEEYSAAIKGVTHFLKGDYGSLLKELERDMETCSENLEFEKAAKLRDTIRAVKKLGDRQHIVASEKIDADVIGIYSDELGSAVNIFFVRHGAIFDRECLFFGSDELLDSGGITSLLFRFYTMRGYVPHEIYLGYDLAPEDRELLCEKLSPSGKTRIIRPQKGEKKELLLRSESNARDLMLHKREVENKTGRFARSLADFLRLDEPPARIEAYDVSNHGDEDIVCGMAVWENGRFAKRKYRSFNMKTVSMRDDYSSMREAVGRRLAHSGKDWEYPDIILLDGGENHVAVIKRLLEEKNTDIPVFGMIKDEHHKTRTLTDGENEISLNGRQDIFNFFYKFQEEVHNAAFGKMDMQRRKKLTSSSLLEIPGVGKKTAETLLNYFGGLKAIKNASFEELASVKGVSRKTAQTIKDFYSEKDKK
ncbi:MAG: excinuclease ABC subunit UvrC [Clostridia bacterium]|nr:excinuclease ABC subunit UvrC [Clostridia bacterium]